MLVCALAFGAFALTACHGIADPGHPLSIKLTPDRTTAVTGQDVGFQVNATGRVLAAIVVDYDDGVADTVPTSGASSVYTTFSHAFQQIGSYIVNATAFDAFDADSISDAATIDVGPASAALRPISGLTTGRGPPILLPSQTQPR